MSKKNYTEHLMRIRDWRHEAEKGQICRGIEANVPEHLWVVEVSVPELFPANLRKLGEIVLDATKAPSSKLDYRSFLFGRFPGTYVLVGDVRPKVSPTFVSVPSALRSHTPLY